MNEILTAIFLGFIEGLTEFIPVSSTAHLIVFTQGLKFPAPPGHVFEVFIQLGAILAVVVLYRRKLCSTLININRDQKSRRFALNLIIGTIPTLIAGACAHAWIKDHLYNTTVIAIALIAGGIFILLLERKLNNPSIRNIDDIRPNSALFIGFCQVLALIPGISRSGATIMGGRASGMTRAVAAEFSFFLAIPLMCAAVAYDLYSNWASLVTYDHPGLMCAGFVSAFFSALVVIKLALTLINRYGFAHFAWYRIMAGLVILFVFA